MWASMYFVMAAINAGTFLNESRRRRLSPRESQDGAIMNDDFAALTRINQEITVAEDQGDATTLSQKLVR